MYLGPRQAETTTSSTAERSEEHTSELQSQSNLVCRLLLEKKTSSQPPGPLCGFAVCVYDSSQRLRYVVPGPQSCIASFNSRILHRVHSESLAWNTVNSSAL